MTEFYSLDMGLIKDLEVQDEEIKVVEEKTETSTPTEPRLTRQNAMPCQAI